MERGPRVIGSVDNFDGQQNLDEWIQMVGRAAEFAGWTEEATFKAAMFRLRGEAGEHAEQLKTEGKLKTWKELQEVLRDRFETAGKEQWYQYLLNTGTQGSKTVQEWAQTVRKLSLKALGPEATTVKREEGDPPQNQEQEREAEAKKKEGRKNLLDYTRRTNFVRGLRSSLRQQVWRKKCKNFDDAVKAAAEEEVVEASHREEEVLSCYKKEVPDLATSGLVERIVAALELREEAKKNLPKVTQEDTDGGERSPKDKKEKSTRKMRPQTTDDEGDDEGVYQGHRGGLYPPAGRRYEDQLPLPRQARGGEWGERRYDQGRPEVRDGRYGARPQHNRCYNCDRIGHYARNCRINVRPQQGNGFRRPQ